MDEITRLRLEFLLIFIGLIACCVAIFFVRRHFDRKALKKGTTPKPSISKPQDAYQIFWSQYISSGGQFSAYRDGLDTRLFDQMSPGQLWRAEMVMLLRLYDWRSVYGLGRIRSQKAKWPLQLMQKWMPGAIVMYVEQALMRIGERSG